MLQQEFNVDNVDEILAALGIGKPDLTVIANRLTNASTQEEIEMAFDETLGCSDVEMEFFIDSVKDKTNKPKSTLSKIAKAMNKAKTKSSSDNAVVLMETMLERVYKKTNLIRCEDGNFWAFNGRFWDIEYKDQIEKHLQSIAPEILEVHEKTSTVMKSAMMLLYGRVFHKGDPLRFLSEPPTVINCLNGELWFDEKAGITFKPHSAKSYLRHCLNVDYDPRATAPKFNQAVLEIFRDSINSQEMHRHFVEFMGYACQGWRKIPTIMMFYGGGGNGKTQLAGIIQNLIGQQFVMSSRMGSIEKDKFAIGALNSKLLLIDDDVDAGTWLPDGFLKKISEEKPMTGDIKFANPIQFTCRALPLMLANEFPNTKDLSDGLDRRVQIIPFKRKFLKHEMIPGLFDTIWDEEKSGILNLAIEGFQRIKARQDFLEPTDCVDAKNKWKARCNPIVGFIDECCETGDGLQQHITDFYAHLKLYAERHGIKNLPRLSVIKNRLEVMGYQFVNHSRVDVVLGLRCTFKLTL